MNTAGSFIDSDLELREGTHRNFSLLITLPVSTFHNTSFLWKCGAGGGGERGAKRICCFVALLFGIDCVWNIISSQRLNDAGHRCPFCHVARKTWLLWILRFFFLSFRDDFELRKQFRNLSRGRNSCIVVFACTMLGPIIQQAITTLQVCSEFSPLIFWRRNYFF